jgi:bacteriocin biosynthesis cyclodehydratase domain-containing protein
MTAAGPPQTGHHVRMVLRLDPLLPLLWRTPTSLQFGLDEPRVVLEAVSAADERMIAALLVGVSRSGLDMIAASAGGNERETGALLDRLEPALARPPAPEARHGVTIVGRGPAADRLAELMHRSGVAIVADGDETSLVVIVARFVIAPDLHGRWLSRDLPHLPVVFGDTAVRIGPIIEPGAGPCLWCIELARTDADPAWPAIASQLWAREGSAEAPLVADEVATIAARLVLARLSHRPPRGPGVRDSTAATSVELRAADGAMSTTTWRPHPDCLCGAADGGGIESDSPRGSGVSSVRRGIGTVGVPQRGQPPRSTRRGAGADALA